MRPSVIPKKGQNPIRRRPFSSTSQWIPEAGGFPVRVVKRDSPLPQYRDYRMQHIGARRQQRRSGSVRAWETLWLFGSKGRSLLRVPSLGPDRSLHPLNIRPGIQSSTVKLDGHGGVAGVGRGGHRPYIETKCCRLRKTTTRAKNGAQGAHTRHRIESVGLIVGRYRNPHDAHGCPCSKWVLDSSWTPVATFWRAGKR